MFDLFPVFLIVRWCVLDIRAGLFFDALEGLKPQLLFIQAKDLEALSARSADQIAEMQKLQAVVRYVFNYFLKLKGSYYSRDTTYCC